MGVLTQILEVFNSLGEWLSSAVQSMIGMFYTENSLTFLGVLAVAGLGISLIFLLIGVIQNFLHFRG